MSCGNSACRSLFFTTGPVAGGTYPNVKGASVERPNPSIQFSIHSRERFLLRNSWNTSKPVPPRMGPFRMVNNAGDILSRVNYSCGGPNMLNGTTHPKLHLSNTRDGVSTNNCDNSGLEPSTCNVKYVYDSSSGDTMFSLNRRAYTRTANSMPKTTVIPNKPIQQQDASSRTMMLRINAVGKSSVNAKGGHLGFSSLNRNTVNSALAKVRNKGSTAPAKKGFYPKH
jgi:hypothetical protein